LIILWHIFHSGHLSDGFNGDIAYDTALTGESILFRQIEDGFFDDGFLANVSHPFQDGHDAIAAGAHTAATVVHAHLDQMGRFSQGGVFVNLDGSSAGKEGDSRHFSKA
jgi:hypothetical protein